MLVAEYVFFAFLSDSNTDMMMYQPITLLIFILKRAQFFTESLRDS